MPQTPIYGFEYEDPDGDEGVPGRTLTGEGGSPVTAEQVEDEIARVDGDIADVNALLSSLLLDHQTLTGTVGSSGTTLTVPATLRGTFYAYTLRIIAGAASGGTQPRPIVCRINGDGGSVYRYNGIGWDSTSGTAGPTEGSDGSSLPRIGYVGAFSPSIVEVTFLPTSLGDVAAVGWTAHGWVNRGVTAANNVVWQVAGRWNPAASQELQSFLIRTSNVGDVWAANSHATLWGHR